MSPLRIYLAPSEHKIRRVLTKDKRRKLRAFHANEMKRRKADAKADKVNR